VLTLAEAALHSQRPSGIVHDDHRMRTVGLAGAAQVLDLVSGAKYAISGHWAFRIEHRALRRISAT
jgi:hypothetical protein